MKFDEAKAKEAANTPVIGFPGDEYVETEMRIGFVAGADWQFDQDQKEIERLELMNSNLAQQISGIEGLRFRHDRLESELEQAKAEIAQLGKYCDLQAETYKRLHANYEETLRLKLLSENYRAKLLDLAEWMRGQGYFAMRGNDLNPENHKFNIFLAWVKDELKARKALEER